MAKTKKILWVISLLFLIVVATPVHSAEIAKSNFIYLKNGSVIQCDKAWVDGKDIVRCKKGHDEILYSTDTVDLKKTFGESVAKKFEKERKDKELILKQKIAAKKSYFQRHTLEIGPKISNFHYEEPDVMKEKGIMYGVEGSYAYHNNLMLKVECGYSTGQVDYENSGTKTNIDYMIEFRGLGGYDFQISHRSTITPYIGYGYRYLNDGFAGMTSTGATGYERESNYYYSPIGIEIFTDLQNSWSIGAILEYDYFWKGQQKSHLSDVSFGYNDVTNDQKSGFGWRASIKFQKKSERRNYAIVPFIRYWKIKKSEVENLTYFGTVIGTAWEPKNWSREIGLILNIKF